MRQYVVDAFTDKVFSGNQAAVIVVDEWPDEELMKSITRENNFSETAYIKPEGERWHLRWFTPTGEIDLCGHATLASAYVLLNFFVPEADRVEFTTLSGVLIVERQGDLLRMEFPTYELRPVPVTDAMEDALGVPLTFVPQDGFQLCDAIFGVDEQRRESCAPEAQSEYYPYNPSH